METARAGGRAACSRKLVSSSTLPIVAFLFHDFNTFPTAFCIFGKIHDGPLHLHDHFVC